MSKIVQAINAMISNQGLIDMVLQGEDEYFFLYKKKYKWSMRSNNQDVYFLYYYPTNKLSLEQLANFSPDDWQNYSEMVLYRSADIGTKEAKDSFSELYSLLREKIYGVDKVLDDIIGDDDLF